ncbi:Aste57867_19790 [Aphanomyces stellatus]|uniref:Aste57867_19790 protein n=1 Tax=Aphanomyces stellatus TaxID=120398 RepID=A0A485LEL1_9STRA|nr:hypothetical protein As57867_019725 [Aphanomyces stellatus]VFT96488.1 Aste57867_19790 [Aphanomyces stellatus]
MPATTTAATTTSTELILVPSVVVSSNQSVDTTTDGPVVASPATKAPTDPLLSLPTAGGREKEVLPEAPESALAPEEPTHATIESVEAVKVVELPASPNTTDTAPPTKSTSAQTLLSLDDTTIPSSPTTTTAPASPTTTASPPASPHYAPSCTLKIADPAVAEKCLQIPHRPTKAKSAHHLKHGSKAKVAKAAVPTVVRCDSTQVTIKCVEHTVAWLQTHQQHKAASSSFIQSLLHWFQSRPANDDTPPLPLDWGHGMLDLDWTEQSYGVLNAPLYADMAIARRIVRSGRLTLAPLAARREFATWFAEFLDQLSLCDSLKQRVLAEKAQLSPATTCVTTQYDRIQGAYQATVPLVRSDARAYGLKVLACLDEVEAVLTDQERAVRDANATASNPTLENAAFSMLFSRMRAGDAAGVYVAKLVAWMRSALTKDDFNAFFKLLAPEVNECLASNWKEYATHLHRLAAFDADQQPACCTNYTRATAHVTSPNRSRAATRCGSDDLDDSLGLWGRDRAMTR